MPKNRGLRKEKIKAKWIEEDVFKAHYIFGNF